MGDKSRSSCGEDGPVPDGVSVDGSGKVYVSEENNNRVQKFK